MDAVSRPDFLSRLRSSAECGDPNAVIACLGECFVRSGDHSTLEIPAWLVKAAVLLLSRGVKGDFPKCGGRGSLRRKPIQRLEDLMLARLVLAKREDGVAWEHVYSSVASDTGLTSRSVESAYKRVAKAVNTNEIAEYLALQHLLFSLSDEQAAHFFSKALRRGKKVVIVDGQLAWELTLKRKI
jgi:hypothetical protein